MSDYGVQDLEILSPQEHVRRRRGMYIGDADNPSPLFNEIFDNALDETQSGFSKKVSVYVDYIENKYTIIDYGRGFPQGLLTDPRSGKEYEAVELLATTEFSGGKFSSGSYKISTGLHGVGLMVTNSLSEFVQIRTWRDNSLINYIAMRGITKSLDYYKPNEVQEFNDSPSGTCVSFFPDKDIFTDTKIPLSHIIMRCKIASAFGMNIELTVRDEDGNEDQIDVNSDIYDLLPPSDDGISEYYRHSFTVKDGDTGEFATVALQYTSDTKSYYRGYTNLLYNSNGGTHHKILDDAVYEAWNKFDLDGLKWTDIYLGLRGVIAVFISDAEFSSQSKERLSVDKSKLSKLKDLIVDEIYKWLKDDDIVRESLLKRFHEYRDAQNKILSRKEIKSLLVVNDSKDGKVRRTSVVRKLKECSSTSRDNTELFIVEGDSAMGSAQQARDQKTQSLLPIRGKILNVTKLNDLKDALKNEEIRSIVNSIGAGIGDTADPDKSRYEKIILMCDADSDGKNIAVLLAGIFTNLLPELVKQGMVYIALPPLYGYQDRHGEYHFTNNMSDVPNNAKSFQRYKGLGEMNADELWVSTMNPDTRRLVQLKYPDSLGSFNSILSSSNTKYQLLVDEGIIRSDH